MDFITVQQAAEKWGTHPRVVQRACAEGRVPGAVKPGREWRIPADCIKPDDPRRARHEQPAYLPCVFLTSYRAPNDPRLAEGMEHAQYQAELAYLRGNFAPILAYALSVPQSAPTYLCALAIGVSAAISLGDYAAFRQLMDRLTQVKSARPGTDAARYADAALATAAVSLYAPENAPAWLQNGDLSMFPLASRPWLGYLYVKYLLNLRRFEAALAAGRACLMLTDKALIVRLYLLLMCAASCHLLGQEDAARAYLDTALDEGMPDGYLTPFAETVTYFGGGLEAMMRLRWSKQYEDMTARLENTWKRWISFHNQLTKDNVTLILSLQEYMLAGMLATGKSYAEAAKLMHLSVGRIRNLASDIYRKLGISGKAELEPYLML